MTRSTCTVLTIALLLGACTTPAAETPTKRTINETAQRGRRAERRAARDRAAEQALRDEAKQREREKEIDEERAHEIWEERIAKMNERLAREAEAETRRLRYEQYRRLGNERKAQQALSKTYEGARPKSAEIRAAWVRLNDLHVAGVKPDEQKLLRVQLARMFRERAAWNQAAEVARELELAIYELELNVLAVWIGKEAPMKIEGVDATLANLRRSVEAEVTKRAPIQRRRRDEYARG